MMMVASSWGSRVCAASSLDRVPHHTPCTFASAHFSVVPRAVAPSTSRGAVPVTLVISYLLLAVDEVSLVYGGCFGDVFFVCARSTCAYSTSTIARVSSVDDMRCYQIMSHQQPMTFVVAHTYMPHTSPSPQSTPPHPYLVGSYLTNTYTLPRHLPHKPPHPTPPHSQLQIGVQIEEPFSILPLEDILNDVQCETSALVARQGAVIELLRAGGVDARGPRSGGRWQGEGEGDEYESRQGGAPLRGTSVGGLVVGCVDGRGEGSGRGEGVEGGGVGGIDESGVLVGGVEREGVAIGEEVLLGVVGGGEDGPVVLSQRDGGKSRPESPLGTR